MNLSVPLPGMTGTMAFMYVCGKVDGYLSLMAGWCGW